MSIEDGNKGNSEKRIPDEKENQNGATVAANVVETGLWASLMETAKNEPTYSWLLPMLGGGAGLFITFLISQDVPISVAVSAFSGITTALGIKQAISHFEHIHGIKIPERNDPSIPANLERVDKKRE